MDSQVVTKEVTVICGDSQAVGVVTVHYFGSRERLQRALKTAGICIAVTAVCLCIPGAHFVLVPVGLLLSPIVIVRTWRQLSVISALEASCAKCHGNLTRVTTRERYPLFENCLSCHRENQIAPT